MAERRFIEPDLDFVKEVGCLGGDTLKKCFQCATCSVVCNLTPEKKPFPRKEMIWASWGLKERLLSDPDVWLCYQCNDCSAYCPRGAKPGDVLAAVRSYSFMHYATPQFLGKALGRARYLPLLFAFPVILLLFLMGITGHLEIPEGEIVFAKFIPHTILDPLFIAVSILVVISLVVGISRFWNGFKIGVHPLGSQSISWGDLVKLHLIPTVVEILKHSRFKKCERNVFRYLAHLLIFYGFVALAAVTGMIFLGTYTYLGDILDTKLPLLMHHPVKILANLGALSLFIGCTIVISNRLRETEDKSRNTYFDWAFVIILYLVAISGILTEVVRLSDIAVLAYWLYFLHLVLVFYLLAYLPFSKFAHLIYRTVALVYASYSGREK